MIELSNGAIERLPVRKSIYTVADSRLPQLHVRVRPSGRKVFFLAYHVAGTKRARERTLGDTTHHSLGAARRWAIRILAQNVGFPIPEPSEPSPVRAGFPDLLAAYFQTLTYAVVSEIKSIAEAECRDRSEWFF